MSGDHSQSWLAGTSLGRRLTSLVWKARARRRLADLDRQPADRCQLRTLLGLVHSAGATRFGRDHDFRRVRSAADFRRLVPLRTPAELARDYGQPGDTWPAPLHGLAVRSLQFDGPLHHVALSPALATAHRAAALTALGLFFQARPHAPLFHGRCLAVGSGLRLGYLEDGTAVGDVADLFLRTLPARLRPFAFAASALPEEVCGSPDQRLAALAEAAGGEEVTALAGGVAGLVRFLMHLRNRHRRTAVECWPQLSLVVHTGETGSADRGRLLEALGATPGGGPVLLEACVLPEGPVGLADPRYEALRLLPDHGTYFEFVPSAEVGRAEPTRLGIDEVEPDQPYALALSSPAGVWGCLTGQTVVFLRRDPPLFRLVEPALPRLAPAHPFPPQPPHLSLPLRNSIHG